MDKHAEARRVVGIEREGRVRGGDRIGEILQGRLRIRAVAERIDVERVERERRVEIGQGHPYSV